MRIFNISFLIVIFFVGCTTFNNCYVCRVSMPQNQITDINRSKMENALQKLLKEYELTRVGTIKYKKELYTVYDKPNSKITIWYSPKLIAIEIRASYRFGLEGFMRKLKKELTAKGINIESLREEKEVIPLSNFNI